MHIREPILELTGVCVSQGQGNKRTMILNDIYLSVADGEFVAIVGFSGAGKTTLVSALAGLLKINRGSMRFKGQALVGPSPERGVVFQSYSLMPWLSVRGNVALAVNSVFRGKSKTEREALVDRHVQMVGLTPAADRRPAELSGGMRQRVAVARAMAMQPEMLLLDEPLSALDALTRAKLQDEFADISAREKRTIILITNDVDEAILLADRVLPLTPGPHATLGPEFKVELPRPRERTAMNSNETFIKLRREITEYLVDLGAARSAAHRALWGKCRRRLVLRHAQARHQCQRDARVTDLWPSLSRGRPPEPYGGRCSLSG
ncbi:MAG: nitrate/nitrite transport system ATP-binding protein [Gammaproteobacteria bacterium]|jgi:nitrate/nitrite transport system ATP-binding protein